MLEVSALESTAGGVRDASAGSSVCASSRLPLSSERHWSASRAGDSRVVPRSLPTSRQGLPPQIRRSFSRLRCRRCAIAGRVATLAANWPKARPRCSKHSPLKLLRSGIASGRGRRRSRTMAPCRRTDRPASDCATPPGWPNCGLNVIDGFSGRDLAQDGRGRPLSPLPYWILLHDSQRTEAAGRADRAVRITLLPASRDASGASRAVVVCDSPSNANCVIDAQRASTPRRSFRLIVSQLSDFTGRRRGRRRLRPAVRAGNVRDRTGPANCRERRILRHQRAGNSARAAFKRPRVAVLGLLHLDQVPANVPAITGARTPRVLGRSNARARYQIGTAWCANWPRPSPASSHCAAPSEARTPCARLPLLVDATVEDNSATSVTPRHRVRPKLFSFPLGETGEAA